MVEQPVNEAPLWPGPTDVSARLDRLEKRLVDLEDLQPAVESALVAQAARIETMLSTVRRDLAEAAEGQRVAAQEGLQAVQAEVARTRELTIDHVDLAAGQTTAVSDQVQAVVARLTAEADDRHDAVVAAVRATTGPVETLAAAVDALHRQVTGLRAEAADDRRAVRDVVARLAELPAAIDPGLRDVAEALAEHRSVVESAGTAARAQAEQEAVAARVRLHDAVAAAIEEVRRTGEQAATVTASRLDAAAGRMDHLATGVAALEQALVDHLAELDRRQVVERARLTQAFAEQFADGLSRRERRRLARRLEVPAPEPVPPITSARHTALPAAAPPAAADPEARPPTDAEERPSSDPGQRLPEDDSVPARDDGARADGEPSSGGLRVQPSRRARPVRPTASEPGGPAAARRALAAVRGLGPARQSALIDRFGTLEAIREASDEDLLAIRGIGPALLPAIRDAVGEAVPRPTRP